mmetsp:Transcript_30040/g.95903  ORF Transcript_30040/g.95903 Transcript_30040/m.95903 type:complete len:330 (+) Transcript_30040:994-1983(+)
MERCNSPTDISNLSASAPTMPSKPISFGCLRKSFARCKFEAANLQVECATRTVREACCLCLRSCQESNPKTPPSFSRSNSALSLPNKVSIFTLSCGAIINATAKRWSYLTRSRAAALSEPTAPRKPSMLMISLAVPANTTASKCFMTLLLPPPSPRASTCQRPPSNQMPVTRRPNATSSARATSSRLRSSSVKPPGTQRCVQSGGRSGVVDAKPVASTAPSCLNCSASPALGVENTWAPRSATWRRPFSSSHQKVDMRPAGPRAHSQTWRLIVEESSCPSAPCRSKPSRNNEAANPPVQPPPTTRTSTCLGCELPLAAIRKSTRKAKAA